MDNKTTLPLVSVVMCTYNTEKYIEEAIASILSQTHSNFEFIIWDDGSTDGTRNIVETFKDERIRYYYHENTGLGMALRMACEKAKGKYIARMDSDDISFPTRLEEEVTFLENNPNYCLVSSAVKYIDDRGIVIGRSFPCSENIILKKMLYKSASMISHPMVLMRSDAYRLAGGYIPIRRSQDLLFWSRLSKYGSFYNLSSPLGSYRILNTSLDHSSNKYQEVITAFLVKMINDENVNEEDVKMFNSLFVYCKRHTYKENSDKAPNRTKTTEEYIFSFFKKIIGEKASEYIVVKFKNLIYHIKLI